MNAVVVAVLVVLVWAGVYLVRAAVLEADDLADVRAHCGRPRARGREGRAVTRLDLAIAVALSLATCEGRAQPRDEALDLARLCVHEAGWTHPADCAAIYAVAVHGGERTGMAWHRWLGVYARRFARREVRRQWVYRLDRAASDPRAGIGWRAYRPRWLAILAAADAAVAAPIACEATDWGSDADMRRRAAQRRRFRVVDCGETRGIYSVRGER